MLTKSQEKNQLDYWQETTADNYKTMLSLYRSKRYSACLFFGHLVLEKALKILVIKRAHNFAPRIHNLLRLAELAGLTFTKEEEIFLGKVNEFNMEARYPEDKLQFYKKCTKSFTDQYYGRIKKMHQRLCQQTK